MPRQRTGQIRYRNGRWYTRLTVRGKSRVSLLLPHSHDERSARTRAQLLAEMAGKLRDSDQLALAPALLEKAASCSTAELPAVRRLVDAAVAGRVTAKGSRREAKVTFRELATMWTSGQLARDYPDHVRAKARVRDDVGRLVKHIYPVVADVPVADFTLDDAEAVMSALPTGLSPSTRRHIGQLVHRVLALAVFPMRLRSSSPLPRGWLPRARTNKAKAHLFADEERRLLGCTAVPLARRVAYGLLAREGMRKSEAKRLSWSDVDLERGAITLDVNKTKEPRAWALGQDVTTALRWWREASGYSTPSDPVLVGIGELRSDDFRDDLRAAGITRPQLFDCSKQRQPIRVHDLRGTFVTLALAMGRTEAWVADRTGHRSSQMINVYRRPARAAAKLGSSWLAPMDEAIVEIRERMKRPRKRPEKAPADRRNARIRGNPQRFSVGHEGLEPSANGLRVRFEKHRNAPFRTFMHAIRT